MSLYLLHLEPGYLHAKHYLGFTPDEDVTCRVSEHLACGAKASPLVKAAIRAGSRFTVVRTSTGPDASRTREREIKNTAHVPKYCPICRQSKKAAKQSALAI